MIRLLRWLLTGDGHAHHWETLERRPLTDDFGSSGTRVYQRCLICGTERKKDFL